MHGQGQTHLLNLRYMECERINYFSLRKCNENAELNCQDRETLQKSPHDTGVAVREFEMWGRQGLNESQVRKNRVSWDDGVGEISPSEAISLEYDCRTWLVDRQHGPWHHRGTQFKFKLSWDFNYVLLPYSFGMSTKSKWFVSCHQF